MPRLEPPTKRQQGSPPEEANPYLVRKYLNMSRWQLGYISKAFEADGRHDVAKLLREALENVNAAKDLWRK